MDDRAKEPAVETDARFPSGSWVGHWVQRGWGKQRTSVALKFCDGRITGEGSDILGKFVFTGHYDLKTGRCEWTKQYVGAHTVRYEGVSEGRELWLWGLWHVKNLRGGFHLWPEGEADPTEKRTGATTEVPEESRRRQRVPSDLLPV
jgi:hypothetical protein